MAGETAGALHLYAVVIDANLDICSNAVVPVEHSIGDNFVQCFIRVADLLHSTFANLFYAFDDFLGVSYGLLDDVIDRTFDCERVEGQSFTI